MAVSAGPGAAQPEMWLDIITTCFRPSVRAHCLGLGQLPSSAHSQARTAGRVPCCPARQGQHSLTAPSCCCVCILCIPMTEPQSEGPCGHLLERGRNIQNAHVHDEGQDRRVSVFSQHVHSATNSTRSRAGDASQCVTAHLPLACASALAFSSGSISSTAAHTKGVFRCLCVGTTFSTSGRTCLTTRSRSWTWPSRVSGACVLLHACGAFAILPHPQLSSLPPQVFTAAAAAHTHWTLSCPVLHLSCPVMPCPALSWQVTR